jgi:biopolymer transport protein ExbD
MRTGAIVLALLLAGCGGPDGAGDAAGGGANAAVPRPDLPEAGSTLTLSAAGTGGCSARWDGAAVTREQLLERAAAAIDRAVAAVGGVQNVSAEAIPVVRVEAPADLSFACVDAMLAAVQRAGFPRLILAPAGGAEPELTSFPLTEIGPPPPAVVVRIGAGGRMTWNNEAVDAAGLTERARRMGGLDDRLAAPGEVEIRPAREASFGAVHAAVAAIRQGNVQATLLPPSVEPRPRPPIPADPAPAPAPAAGPSPGPDEPPPEPQ